RGAPLRTRRAAPLSGLARAADDGCCVLRGGMLAIGPPAPELGVAEIDDLGTGRPETSEQTGVTQCARRLLLPRRVRTGARGHADHAERPLHPLKLAARRDEAQPR